MQNILSRIQSDEVRDACTEIKKNEGHGLFRLKSYSSLVSLNNLVWTSLKKKTSCNSPCRDIYNLAELCCDDDSSWELNQAGCMQCVLHIAQYLLSQGEPLLAKKLCEQLFLHCKKQKTGNWEEKEVIVLKSMLFSFIKYLIDENKRVITEEVPAANSIVSWFSFLIKLNEFNDYESTSDFFKWCYSFTKKFCSMPNIARDIIKQFSLHLKKIISKNHNWKPTKEIIINSVGIISTFIHDERHFSSSCYLSCKEFIKCLKSIIISYPIKNISMTDIDLLDSTLHLFYAANEDNFEVAFKSFFETFQAKEGFAVEILPLIFECLSVVRTNISRCLAGENSNVVKTVKIIFQMFIDSNPKQVSDSKRGYELLHAFTTAIYLMWTAKLDSASLKELCKTVRMFFHGLNYLVKNLSKGQSIFQCGVAYCVNIIQSYRDAELYPEVATLSRDMVKYILQMNSDLLPIENFKAAVETLLNLFVTSYGKVGLSDDALNGLLAFAGVHPKFTTSVFKYWAELKVNFSSQCNLEKDSTCYDIFSSSKSSLEKNWPPCVAESINIEKCLLEEMKSYAKHRELQMGPSLAVFRTAVKIIKDKIILAQVLTATVDCVATCEYTSSFQNLQLSLKNILGSLTRLKAQTTDPHKICHINCLTSDVLYHLIRIEISQIRKKVDEELELLNVPPKENIPVIEGEETKNIAPAYSHLILKDHHGLTRKLQDVFDSWSAAAQTATAEDQEYFVFRFLKGFAYILKLYDFKSLEVDSWRLIYSLSKKFSNTKYKILALSELLGLVTNVDLDWIKDAEDTLNEDDAIKKTYIYPLFLTNRVKNYYLNRNYVEMTKLLEEIDPRTMTKFYQVNARHIMLIFQLKLYKTESISTMSEELLLSMVKYFEHVLYTVKMNTWHSFSEKCIVEWLLLESSLLLGRTYLDMRMMRHALFYAKKQLRVAQALALPIKVCEFLSILCSADLVVANSEEATGKLYGLDTILGLDSISLPESESSDFFYSKKTDKSEIKHPDFLSHNENCDCLECSNIPILMTILNTFKLKTTYTLSLGAQDLARHTATIVEDMINYISKKLDLMEEGYLVDFAESKARCFLILSQCWALWGELETATDYIRAAGEAVSSAGPRIALLVQEIAFQSETLKCLSYIPPPTITYVPKLYTEDKVSVESARTPEPVRPLNSLAKHLKKVMTPASSKIPITPRHLQAKKLLFDAFEKEVEGNYAEDYKENIESPKTKTSTDRSPLAKVLVFTPKINGCSFETPMPKEITKTTRATRTRLAQTEKKGKKLFDGNVYATPFQSRKKPEIKVFCDDEDDMEPVITTRKKKTTTTKKIKAKVVKKPVSEIKSSRKLAFESDSEEDLKESGEGRPKLERRLFGESGEESGGNSIIEASFLETPESSLCLPLTPLGLEDSMKRLAISGRTLAPLSTRKMKRLPPSEDCATPTSTTLLPGRPASQTIKKTTRK